MEIVPQELVPDQIRHTGRTAVFEAFRLLLTPTGSELVDWMRIRT